MSSELTSIVPSLAVLGLLALVAAFLAVQRRSPPQRTARRGAAALMLAIAAAVQAVHFGEELATGFHVQFPALFGLPPMPLPFFVLFNLVWLVLWLASVPGVQRAHAPAYFAAWFLALGGILNGIAHPLLALAAGSYFPGLFTSPLTGVAGVVLWRQLAASTEAVRD